MSAVVAGAGTAGPAGTAAPAVPARRRARAVPWATAVVVSLLMASAAGVVTTAMRSAVGTPVAERTPVLEWLVRSAVLLPAVLVLVVAVLVAAGRRWSPPTAARTIVTVVLLAVAGTLVGVAALGVDALVDHADQVRRLDEMAGMSGMGGTGGMSGPDAAATAADMAVENRAVHLRGIGLGAAVLLAVDVLVVGWVVALRGGDLAVGRRGDAS